MTLLATIVGTILCFCHSSWHNPEAALCDRSAFIAKRCDGVDAGSQVQAPGPATRVVFGPGFDGRRPLILSAAAPDDGHGLAPARSWLVVRRAFSSVIQSGDAIIKPHDEKPTHGSDLPERRSGQLMG